MEIELGFKGFNGIYHQQYVFFWAPLKMGYIPQMAIKRDNDD